MKRLLTILLAIALTTNVHSQDYSISFEGSGDTTVVDTVIVKNLTQGTSLTVNGNDQLRLVENVTGLKPVKSIEYNILRIYPNPIKENGTVEFEAPRSGFITIEVYDISGKKVLQESKYFEKGTNLFQISGLGRGFYCLKVKSNGFNYTGKIVSQSNTRGLAQINYTGQTNKPVNVKLLKSENAEVQMQYNTGDRLKLTGISGNYSTVVIDIPTESKSISFNFIACTDEDGNNYPIVTIGVQTWMAENLKTTKYNDDTAIPNVIDDNVWWFLETPAFCWYNNEVSYKSTYGAFYNWYTVNTGKLCPIGWHVPSDAEWTTLVDYLGGESIAGGKLKETDTIHWSSPNTGATNETGFTALPGGHRMANGPFDEIGNIGRWWSATESDFIEAWYRNAHYDKSNVYRHSHGKMMGVSVRCVRD